MQVVAMACCRAFCSAGSSMEAKMAMMAMTTSSSMSVKFLFIESFLFYFSFGLNRSNAFFPHSGRHHVFFVHFGRQKLWSPSEGIRPRGMLITLPPTKRTLQT